jgi:hypothetical protein
VLTVDAIDKHYGAARRQRRVVTARRARTDPLPNL